MHELCRRLAAGNKIIVITSSSPGALQRESLDGVEVWRYRYAPRRFETLVHGGGMLQQMRTHRWKAVLLIPFALGQIFALARAIRIHRPDVLHAHWSIPQGLSACIAIRLARAKVPLLVTSHGADVFGLGQGIFACLRRWVGRRTAIWSVVSSRLKQQLLQERVLPEGRDIRVIPMGTNLIGRFRPIQAERVSEQILYVGRLVPGKGLDVLLNAMPGVLAVRPDATLLIVGDGPLATSLAARVADGPLNDRVKFLGMLPSGSLPDLYSRSAVHVAPFTVKQGFGLTLIESIGCGCPIITTELGEGGQMTSLSAMVRLVRPGDETELADAIVATLVNPPTQDQANEGVAFVRSRYDWKVVESSFRDIYRDLTSRSPA